MHTDTQIQVRAQILTNTPYTQGDADIGTVRGTGKYIYPTYIQAHIHTTHTHIHIIHMRTKDYTTANMPLDLHRCKSTRDTCTHISSHTQACAHVSIHTAFLELKMRV